MRDHTVSVFPAALPNPGLPGRKKNMERTDIKRIQKLTALACMVYFCSYLSRINFSAILVDFLATENLSKASASTITATLFVTYGFGQILSGYLGDRIRPRGMIFAGLTTAAVCNGLMPVCSPCLPALTVVWGVNGAAQALIWPPLAKILTNNLSSEEYGKRVPLISTSSSVATIMVYLLAPWAIRAWNWRAVLYTGCVSAGLGAIVWLHGSKEYAGYAEEVKASEPDTPKAAMGQEHRILRWMFPGILLGISCQGALRDGITTWMPTLVSEVFSLEGSVTILSGVALPIFQMSATLCVHWLLDKMRGAVFSCASLLFAAVGMALGLLAAGGMDSPGTCVAGIAVATGFIQGINVLQTCYIPVYFQNIGRVSLISGLVNAATYGGSAISIRLFGAISERSGWSAVVGLWIELAAAGVLLSGICAAACERRINYEKRGEHK